MTKVTVVGEVIVDRVHVDGHVTIVGGGSAANMALALARSGTPVSIRARYSLDENGQYLRNLAIESGVDVSDSVLADEPATVVDVHLNVHGFPHYSFPLIPTADWQWTAGEISKPLPPETRAVIFGSLAAVLDPGSLPQIEWAQDLKNRGITIFFDPNARPTALTTLGVADQARDRILQWIRLADVVKVSQEDVEWLDTSQSPDEVVKVWSTQGPHLVVMTRGADGATAYAHGVELVKIPAPQVAVVDTVGAGDTFMAWLVRGYLEHGETLFTQSEILQSVVATATKAAAINCSRVGCNPPTLADLVSFKGD